MTLHKEEYSLIPFDKELLEIILFAIDIPLMIFNQDRKILYANDRFYHFSKLTPEEVLDRKIEVNPDRLKSHLYFFTVNVRIRTIKDKDPINAPLNIIPFEYNQDIYYLGTIHDGYYDVLTGFPNFSIFEMNLEKAIRVASRRNKNLAILFVDLDRFKFINDTYGHLIGDILIQKVSKIFESIIRIDDFITRKGGDEFIILLNDLAKKEDIMYVIEKIFSHFREPFEIENQRIPLTLSIGISVFPDDGNTVKELIQKADYVMYKAKKKYENSYVFCSEELEKDLRFRHQIEYQLLQDYKNNFRNFEIFFQPIFMNVQNNRFALEGTEVYLKWKINHKEYIDANFILEIAQSKGIIYEIDKFIFLQVIKLLKDHSYMQIPIYINVSSRMFYDIHFISYITETIKEYELPLNLLVIEVQGKILNKNIQHSYEILKELKKHGFSICIDDFVSSSVYLPILYKIKPQYLKINFNIAEKDIPVFLEIIDSLYFIFKPNIIANKIESFPIFRELVRSKRIHYFQGFHFAKPFNLEQFIKYLEKGVLYEF